MYPSDKLFLQRFTPRTNHILMVCIVHAMQYCDYYKLTSKLNYAQNLFGGRNYISDHSNLVLFFDSNGYNPLCPCSEVHVGES